jgi:hypothetical protein
MNDIATRNANTRSLRKESQKWMRFELQREGQGAIERADIFHSVRLKGHCTYMGQVTA